MSSSEEPPDEYPEADTQEHTESDAPRGPDVRFILGAIILATIEVVLGIVLSIYWLW